MGFDVRTSEQKADDKRQKEISHQWAVHALASRYNREEIYKEIWLRPIQHVTKRYNRSDVGLGESLPQAQNPAFRSWLLDH